jgi:hypothetical protein
MDTRTIATLTGLVKWNQQNFRHKKFRVGGNVLPRGKVPGQLPVA